MVEEIQNMEIGLVELFALLLAHLIGDFFLQTDEMARGKSSSDTILYQHVGIYIMPFAIIAFYVFPVMIAFLFLISNLLLHFMTDYVSSRVAKSYFEREKRHEFFITIGIDQFIHVFTLAFTFIVAKGMT